MKELYNKIYKNNPDYNSSKATQSELKYKYISNFIKDRNSKSVLDVGCGSGYNLRKIYNEGYDVFGIEISDYCCSQFLSDLPHRCIDIENFYYEDSRLWDCVVCMDVLEHIPYSRIENTIAYLETMSRNALFGIANHSDIQLGEELHLIQEKSNWWTKLLTKYYSSCKMVDNLFNDKFYIIECKN